MSHFDNEGATPVSPKGLLIKLGALVAGLVVVGYVGLRLGHGDVSLPNVPFVGSVPSAPAAHVLTPEEDVQASIKANPALVSRQACMNLNLNAPAVLTMLSHPSAADLDGLSNDELRSMAFTLAALVPGRPVAAMGTMFTNHAAMVNHFVQASALPIFANPNGAETQRVNAYLDTCRSMYPGRDEDAAAFVRVRAYTLMRIGFNVMSLVQRHGQ